MKWIWKILTHLRKVIMIIYQRKKIIDMKWLCYPNNRHVWKLTNYRYLHPWIHTKKWHATIWRILIIWFLLLISLKLQSKTGSSRAISLNKVAWLIFYIVLKLTHIFDMNPRTHNDYFHCKNLTKSQRKLKFCTTYSY